MWSKIGKTCSLVDAVFQYFETDTHQLFLLCLKAKYLIEQPDLVGMVPNLHKGTYLSLPTVSGYCKFYMQFYVMTTKLFYSCHLNQGVSLNPRK